MSLCLSELNKQCSKEVGRSATRCLLLLLGSLSHGDNTLNWDPTPSLVYGFVLKIETLKQCFKITKWVPTAFGKWGHVWKMGEKYRFLHYCKPWVSIHGHPGFAIMQKSTFCVSHVVYCDHTLPYCTIQACNGVGLLKFPNTITLLGNTVCHFRWCMPLTEVIINARGTVRPWNTSILHSGAVW